MLTTRHFSKIAEENYYFYVVQRKYYNYLSLFLSKLISRPFILKFRIFNSIHTYKFSAIAIRGRNINGKITDSYKLNKITYS